MPTLRDIQQAFNQGEISPLLYGRGDLNAYHAALADCENWIPLRPGGLERRTGSIHLTSIGDPTTKPKLISFNAGDDASYSLLFEAGVFRAFTQSGVVICQTHLIDYTQDVDISDGDLHITAHGYHHGAGPFRLTKVSAGNLPNGWQENKDYYAELVQPVNITAVDTGTNTLTASHNYTENMGPFRWKTSNSMPSGLDPDTDYYVITVTATTFQLSLTPGGGAVTLTTTGSGGQSLNPTKAYQRNSLRLSDSPGFVGTIITPTDIGDVDFTISPLNEIQSQFDHPFSATEIQNIRTGQSADVAFVTTGGRQVQKISRYAPWMFQVEEATFSDGPYLIQQETAPGEVDLDVTISTSSTTGDAVTFTASKAIFTGTDVGRPIRLGFAGVTNAGWGNIISVPSINWTTVNEISITAIDVNTGTEVISKASHGFDTGEVIHIDVTQYGLTAGVAYYVNTITAGSFSVHTTRADAVADTNRVNLVPGSGTRTIRSAWIQATGHGLSSRHGPVSLQTTQTLPAGLSVDTAYWLDSVDTNHVMLTDSPGGNPMLTSDDGTGTHTIFGTTLPSATCTVKIEHDLYTTSATKKWKLGAFSADPAVGWPRVVTLYEQRLCLAGTSGQPQTLFLSNAGSLLDFAPDLADDNGLERAVTAANSIVYDLVSEEVSTVEWMLPLQTLLVGSRGGVWSVQGTTISEPLSPDSINARRQSRVGSANVEPVSIGNAVLFVSEGRRTVRGARFNFEQNAVIPADLMLLAEHLGEAGTIDQLAYTGAPRDILWAVRSDGVLLSLTYDPQQSVSAWARQVLGGDDAVVETVATSSNATGENDQVWMVVKRTIDGVVRRDVEYLAPRFDSQTAAEDAHFVDAGVQVTAGAPAKTFTGLTHLEGETVQILADGARQPDVVVSGGQITIARNATKVHIGLACDAHGKTLPVEFRSAKESSVISGLIKRIQACFLRIHRTGVLAIGNDRTDLVELDMRNAYSDPADGPAALRSDVVEVPTGSGYNRSGGFAFAARGPMPAAVLQAQQRVTWSDR